MTDGAGIGAKWRHEEGKEWFCPPLFVLSGGQHLKDVPWQRADFFVRSKELLNEKKNISKLSLQIFFIFQNSKYLEITQIYPKSDGILKKKSTKTITLSNDCRTGQQPLGKWDAFPRSGVWSFVCTGAIIVLFMLSGHQLWGTIFQHFFSSCCCCRWCFASSSSNRPGVKSPEVWAVDDNR